ncbi:MAG: FAD-dependent oxidoreductase [Bifidobacteriaceae bacterium]|jgi:2,4-dienoyl-CoA reductase-like NADH-dependent reductase (Old Yellow Enzyme family)/thioredoxin reductase|nr:FAD-dependent oxidoreductase [Bifidobacteriaceae bacterium]
MHHQFPTLFSPLRVGKTTWKNRIASAPMSLRAEVKDYGSLLESGVAQYELIAKGGAAAVVIGETLVHPATGNNHGGFLRLDTPTLLPHLSRCTDAIHRHGALASIELLHPGERADPAYNAEGKVYGPSAGFEHYGDGSHRVEQLDEELIAVIAAAFGDAAELAQWGGCDFVTVHAGHGWLISQFLAPATNRREDRFGGPLANRARFALMVAESIRAKCGPDFPIEFRISGDDLMPGGATQEDLLDFAELLAPKIDLIHVSAANFHNRRAGLRMFPSMFTPRGVNVYLAAAVKRRVSIPVVTVGGLGDPRQLEEILATGQADAVALARTLVADPMMPRKALRGRAGDITPCVRCNTCLSVGFVPYVKFDAGVAHCAVNPWFGLDAAFLRRDRVPAAPPLRVMVVGAGPAGLEAALGAAERGHAVSLWEKSERVGGMLELAGRADFKADIGRFVAVLAARVATHPLIDLRLGQEATPALVEREAPDCLIVAIGARPAVPPIAGLDDPRVAWAASAARPEPAPCDRSFRVVVIGGGQVGVEEGLAWAKAGASTTIVEMTESFAADAPYLHHLALTEQIELLDNLELRLGWRASAIEPRGVAGRPAGAHAAAAAPDEVLPADLILIAAGLVPLRAGAEAFIGSAPSVRLVGDCAKAGQMNEAVLAGYFAGYNAA